MTAALATSSAGVFGLVTNCDAALSLLCLLVLLVIGWRLHFVHPVPLPACNFDGHRGGDSLLEAINCRESRDDEAQNDHGGDVEKQILSLHQELVVSPDVK